MLKMVKSENICGNCNIFVMATVCQTRRKYLAAQMTDIAYACVCEREGEREKGMHLEPYGWMDNQIMGVCVGEQK